MSDQTSAPGAGQRRALDAGIVFLLLVFSLVLRVVNISQPYRPYFDEKTYVAEAQSYLLGQGETNTGHPPLGKLAIAASMRVASACGVAPDDPLSWRFGSVVCGALMPPLVYLLGLWMFRSRHLAAVAGGLLCVDFLHLVQSRIAMLDIFESLFVLIGLACCWRAIQLQFPWRWVLASGVAFGLAIATKYSGVFAALGALAACWWLQEATSAAVRWRRLLPLAAAWSIAALLVWGLTLIPLWQASGGDVSVLASRVSRGWGSMWRYHVTSPERPHHPFISPWWQWPMMVRPVWYYRLSAAGTHLSNGGVRVQVGNDAASDVMDVGGNEDRPLVCVVGMGNPWVWWPFLLMLASLLGRSRDDDSKALTFCTITYAAQVVLWFPMGYGFVYYMLPTTPLMALVVAHTVCRRMADWVRILYLGLCLVTLLAYWPLLTATPVAASHLQVLMGLPSWR